MMNTWNPKIASLPDLSTMVSKTFINEVEISQIKKGQHVNIGLDAFPDKKLEGKVQSISNVGQKNPNSDGKVFEVTIEIATNDSSLRPAMTTSNDIVIEKVEDVIIAPLEGIFSQGDTLNYVIIESGMGGYKKKQVELGKSNDNFVIIENGLAEGDEVMLNSPEDLESIETEYLN